MEYYSRGFFNQANQQPIIEGFREWIVLQNYEPTTKEVAPKIILEFMQWCEKWKVEEDHARHFFEYQQRRKNKNKEGGLAVGTLRVYLRVLRMFRRYLREVLSRDLDINIVYKEVQVSHHDVLTRAEIKRLYEVIDDDLLGMRDRAMLGIYYGCGLRRNEGASLVVDDIQAEKNLIYVRKGKNYKERYVPMVGITKQHILSYLTIARPGLLNGELEAAFFISTVGKKLGGSGLYERLRRLARKAEIEKSIGLHSLRHSIATHLLENGMKLNQIAKLLGHATLDTTQIYTHILNDLQKYDRTKDL